LVGMRIGHKVFFTLPEILRFMLKMFVYKWLILAIGETISIEISIYYLILTLVNRANQERNHGIDYHSDDHVMKIIIFKLCVYPK